MFPYQRRDSGFILNFVFVLRSEKTVCFFSNLGEKEFVTTPPGGCEGNGAQLPVVTVAAGKQTSHDYPAGSVENPHPDSSVIRGSFINKKPLTLVPSSFYLVPRISFSSARLEAPAKCPGCDSATNHFSSLFCLGFENSMM